MPESKNIPQIKRLQGGILIPYNVQQITRMNEEDEQETFYKFRSVKLDQQLLPSLAEVAEYIWRQLQADLHAHIYSQYDQGSQTTIQAYVQQASRQGLTKIVDECEKIMNWISESLDYYYTKKDELFGAGDEAKLIGVNWDFESNCPKPKDLKGLREIKGMFQ